MKGTMLLFLFAVSITICKAQKLFTRADSLRGALRPERTWWDVQRYDIDIIPDLDRQYISSICTIDFRAVSDGDTMQIDLQEPMQINKIWLNSIPLDFTHDGNVWWVYTKHLSNKNSENYLKIEYAGSPKIAKLPPWDGGIIYQKDSKGKPFVSIACQGLGASVWYTCKDHQSDEPDHGSVMHITVPDSLMAISNGRLIQTLRNPNATTTYTWEVKNPINNYNIIPYIGDYVHIHDTLRGEKGILDLDYYVLREHEVDAKNQFIQAKSMIHCFEYWFGPYPFYEDGYKLIEAPHLGMEHQSAIAYGNGFKNGYKGIDRSRSGWGLKWDFIIIHESGHEWFGNNITSRDVADMWIHESFTNYSETLYSEWLFGKEAGNEYLQGERHNIKNKAPIIGIYNVNEEGSGDMYDKGGNMIHTIRQILHDDTLFRNMLRDMNKRFYHSTTTSDAIEKYITSYTHHDFSKLFDQYLRHISIPKLNVEFKGKRLFLNFSNCIPGFNMPVRIPVSSTKYRYVTIGEKATSVKCTLTSEELSKNWDKNYYIEY